MSAMTKIEGVPDSDSALPGMAFFAGTGPAGATCGLCKHRGYFRQSARGSFDKRTNSTVHKSYRVTKCAQFKRMTGRHGSDVDADYAACKYFEAAPKT